MKGRFNKHLKIYLLTIFAISILVASNTSYIYGYAVGALSSLQTTIEPGSMASGYSYLVFSSNDVYYAKNGLTGSLSDIAPSVDAYTVINSTLALGGEVQVKKGTYPISSSILMTQNSSSIVAEPGTVFDWVGSSGGSLVVVKASGSSLIVDPTIRNVELRTHDKVNGVYISYCQGFDLDLIIKGDSLGNPYSAVVMDALRGNVAFGSVTNLRADKVASVILTYGSDASHVVTDWTCNNIYATGVGKAGLNFLNWTDTLDIQYFFCELGANGAVAMICNNASNPNNENGVYDIHVNRLIVDDWSYSDCVCVKLNNCKEIKIESLYNGDPRLVTKSLVASTYSASYNIFVQGHTGNNMSVFSKGSGFASGRNAYVSTGDWIQHGCGAVPLAIILTGEYKYICWVANRNSTMFQVGLCYANNVTVADAVINWVAFTQPFP